MINHLPYGSDNMGLEVSATPTPKFPHSLAGQEKLKMNKSKEIYSLIKRFSLVAISCIFLFVYFALLPRIKDFGLPQGVTILIRIEIVFAIIFTVIIAIVGYRHELQSWDRYMKTKNLRRSKNDLFN